MATTQDIAQALVNTGYLSGDNLNAAADVLAKTLTDSESVDARAAALADQAEQEQLKSGAMDFAQQDAAAGNKKDRSIDQAILQDAINKDEVDQSIIKHAEARISGRCKQAAKALASANLEYAAEVIAEAWVS